MAEEFSQDFVLEEAIKARSYWVATMPTKHFYTNSLNAQQITGPWDPSSAQACGNNPNDYIDTFSPWEIKVIGREGDSAYAPTSCYSLNQILFFRPETCIKEGIILCYTANLMDLASSNNFSALNLEKASSNPAIFDESNNKTRKELKNGIFRYRNDAYLLSKSGWRLEGRPVIGFAVQVYVNGSLNGTIANYAVSSKLIRHQTHYPPRN